MHWFNPNVEGDVVAGLRGERPVRNRMTLAMEAEVEAVMLAGCREGDVWLARRVPSAAHVESLKAAGIRLPEMVEDPGVLRDSFAGFRPWAMSRDALAVVAAGPPHVRELAENRVVRDRWFSKEVGVELLEMMGAGERGMVCRTIDELVAAVEALLVHGGVVVKGAYACAGRDQLWLGADRWQETREVREVVERLLVRHGVVVVEKRRDRVLDFSVQYEKAGDEVGFVGMTTMRNDARGRFQATMVARELGGMIPDELEEVFAREEILAVYRDQLPKMIAGLLGGYDGPLGIDGMVYREPGGRLNWMPVVEVNVRMTMGRVALDLLDRTGADSGRFEVMRKRSGGRAGRAGTGAGTGALEPGCIVLNDPEQASEFLVVWSGKLA
ncbi:MAG: hypothetical protein ACQCXQ_07220 [Verrucomicrobiales bacterium]